MTWVRGFGSASVAVVLWVGCYDASSSGAPGDQPAGSSGAGEAGTEASGAPGGGTGGGDGVAARGGMSAGGNAGGAATGGASAGGGPSAGGDAGAGGFGEAGLAEGGASSGAGGASLGGEGGGASGSAGTSGTVGASGEGGVSGSVGSGGDGGSGCTGALEQVENGLCVATMATLPSDDGDYLIDRTEVTRGQYLSWLATNPSPLPVVLTVCAFNDTYEPYEPCAHAEGAGADHHPMTCIDWCDARFYCAAVGKRLCGATEGGPMPYDPDITDWRRDQWGLACNAGGNQIFTYDEPYDAAACNTESSGTVPVASLATCQSAVEAYAGVYDLNGNAREWVDQCRPDNSSPDCYARGGGFDGGSVACANRGYSMNRQTVHASLGFRCCSR